MCLQAQMQESKETALKEIDELDSLSELLSVKTIPISTVG